MNPGFSPIALIEKFPRLGRPKRALVLLAATVLLVVLLNRYLHVFVYSAVVKILQAEERELIFNLVFFDWPLSIAIALLGLFFFTLIMGRPGRQNKPLLIFGKHWWIAFLFLSVLFYLLLVVLPFLLFRASRGLGSDWFAFFDHNNFLRQSVFVSLALSWAVIDTVLPEKKYRWRGVIYLFAPFAPVLWYNGLKTILPSAYWRFWRPVLLGVNCLVPLLAFLAQPQSLAEIRFPDKEDLGPARIMPFDSCFGYQAEILPVSQTVVLNCYFALCTYHFDGEKWRETTCCWVDPPWDEASFDEEKNEAYIYFGKTRILETYDIDTLRKTDIDMLLTKDFPEVSGGIHQAYFPSSRTLVIGENKGRLCAWNMENGDVLASKKIMPSGNQEIWRIAAHQGKNRLYILYNNALSRLTPTDLIPEKTAEFGGRAVDMLVDEPGNRIFVSFPRLMEVMVFDPDTLAVVDRIPAPAAVRALALDRDRNLLIMASYSGTVSVWDLAHSKRIARARLLPFTRRILPLPGSGELLVTTRNYPVFTWQYFPADAPFDLVDKLLQIGELGMKWVIRLNSIGEPEGQVTISNNKPAAK